MAKLGEIEDFCFFPEIPIRRKVVGMAIGLGDRSIFSLILFWIFAGIEQGCVGITYRVQDSSIPLSYQE